MKEQEQKNLNTQKQSPQQNQNKTKAQSPKTKVIVWSTAGAAIAALSSVASLTTVFSNQRKVSFLDKVLQSIKIDVKDKENKTKDDIKTIADFQSSGLNNKLYELIVETEDNQVNKQPLDKDKPYTTFRTKFALRNKITKVQSNYRTFEFRDIKPPKEKAELDKLGKISENEKDRINDKVKIEFLNFNRNTKLASEVIEKDENGNFKHFNIYLKQDNNDALQYEIVNVNVKADDETSTAIFSYQLKVKYIDDDKFTSNVLEVKFDDFAKTSTQLTTYLNSLTFSYENAEQTFIQDAIQTKVIAKSNNQDLSSNYELVFSEFKTQGEHPKKIDAIVKLRDNAKNIISDARSIEITGFKNYETPEQLNSYIDQVGVDVPSKSSLLISEVNNYSEITMSKFDNVKYEIDLGTFLIEKLSDLVSIKVHFRIKEKDGRPGIYSKQISKTITGFKMPQELIEELAQKIKFDVANKKNRMAYDLWDKYNEIQKSGIDNRISIVETPLVKQTDADKITITYKVKDKSNNRESNTYSRVITGFKTSNQNLDDFSYEIVEHNGHKIAFLNTRKNLIQFKVPAKIGSYKVIKVGTLFSSVNKAHSNSPLYGVILEEGIQEVSNLIISSDYGTEYAKIAAIKLPKSIKKISSLINGDSSSLAYLEMYDNVETIEGQLFTTFCNYIDKNENYKAAGTDYDKYYFKLIGEFSNFFSEQQADGGRYGKGSFRFNLLESKETERLKLNTTYLTEFSFLESVDGKTLYKVVDNKNSNENITTQMQYEKTSKNAFSGLKIKTIDLHMPNIKAEEQKNFILERMKNLEEIKLTNHKFDQFPISMLLNDITSLKTITFPDFANDNANNILDVSFNGKSEKVNLPKNVKEIKRKIIDTNNIENLDKLTKLKVLHSNSFSGFQNTNLNFSNCPLEEIKFATFQWTTNNVTIILPKTVKKVEPFILFYTEINGKYGILNNPFNYQDQLSQIVLTGIKKVTIKIKGIQSKPAGWSDYWLGQLWNSTHQFGTEQSILKIEWNSTN
ncbi:leucine-rich repeat protein [Metamycoplasma hyosynoviae]|uniref:leucine-rich repeat protein n=1 Tax=Metamycoplasma hyosynoviae TaxID=29559 RepID=UPI00249CE751|nr:leucine-rich repeat protein [Metamycoplasma hyosynoviae]MDI3063937.1 leucine-rich repeat protein [Metamycoplasma hyosynoviae]